MTALRATTLAPGDASAPVAVLVEPLSFWGGFDARTGRVIDRWHPQCGVSLAGRVLVMRAGRGSSSGSSVLAEAIRLGNGPAAIVLLSRDAILTTGALVAAELYGVACPVVMAAEAHWPAICAAETLSITATDEAASLQMG